MYMNYITTTQLRTQTSAFVNDKKLLQMKYFGQMEIVDHL